VALSLPLLLTCSSHSTGGLKFAGINQQQLLAYESAVMDVQTQLEDSFRAIAKANRRASVILCDRGTVLSRVRRHALSP